MVGGLRDVITCAEFQIEIFMGYDFTRGRIFDFPIDFSMGLTTVQRYCAACDDNGLYQDLNRGSTQLGALSYQAITKTCELKRKFMCAFIGPFKVIRRHQNWYRSKADASFYHIA